jgi:hypothetical protein
MYIHVFSGVSPLTVDDASTVLDFVLFVKSMLQENIKFIKSVKEQ